MKLWNKIKKWSGWSTAGSIFMRRMEVLGGVITAGMAALATFDWMPYITSSEINWRTVGIISGYLVVMGIVGEIVRRHKAEDL